MTDFFVAGSWRNRSEISKLLDVLDELGFSVYSFVRATYPRNAAAFAVPGGVDAAAVDDPGVRVLFEQDLEALRRADRFIIVLPAGAAAHVEAGMAYGFGKPCYAVGPAERSETLYRIFDQMFHSPAEFRRWFGPPKPVR